MKIKWNWGTGITLFIIIYMLSILFRVYLTTKHPVSLVEKDYYPKGLQYEERIHETINAIPLRTQFVIKQLTKEVVFYFPKMNPDTSNLHVFRPSDEKLDISCEVNTDSSNTMRFPVSKFHKGKYIIKLYWVENKKGYYIEKNFYFN